MLDLQDSVVDFLRSTMELGKVVIVTMAATMWIDKCLERMPAVREVIKELKIEIVCAREAVPYRVKRAAFMDDRDPSQFLKTKAMENVIKRFYKQGGSSLSLSRIVGRTAKKRSWKNIISIGDSRAERWALQDLVFRRQQRSGKGEWKECRCKTILMLGTPAPQQIGKELIVLREAMDSVVNCDDDLHLDAEIVDPVQGTMRLTPSIG
jgi:hypothetical protein